MDFRCLETYAEVVGDALGIVTLAPTLLLLDRPWRSHFRQKDGRVLFVGLLATALILYLEVAELLLGHDQGRFSYFVMLPVAWNAVAFGVLGAALSTLLANVSIILALKDHQAGPFRECVLATHSFAFSSALGGHLRLLTAGAV